MTTLKSVESVFGIPLIRASELSNKMDLGKKGPLLYKGLPEHLKHTEDGVAYLNFASLKAFMKAAAEALPKKADDIKTMLTELLARYEPMVEDMYDANILHMSDAEGNLVPVISMEHLHLISPDIHCKLISRGVRYATLEAAATATEVHDPVFAKFLTSLIELDESNGSARRYRAIASEFRSTAELAQKYADAQMAKLVPAKKATTRAAAAKTPAKSAKTAKANAATVH